MATIIIITVSTDPEAAETEPNHTVYFPDETPGGNDLQSIFDAITVAVEESQKS